MDIKTNRKMVDSGVEWIGEVPEGWDVSRIGAEFKVDAGIPAPSDAEPMNDGLTAFVRVSDLAKNPGKLLTQTRDGVPGAVRTYPRGTIIFPKSGESIRTGLRKVLTGGQAVVGHLACLIPKSDSGFGFWVMEAVDFEEETNQTSLPSLNLDVIARKPIPSPPLPLQQAIANYLDHHVGLIDEERELISKKIDLLKEKRSALIFEVVTGKRTLVEAQHLAGVDDWSDIVGSGELRAVPTPRADDPFAKSGRLVDSGVEWIGEMPNSWEIARNKDILKLTKTQVKNGGSAHDLLSLGKKGIVFRDKNSSHGKFPANFDTYQLVNPGDFVFCLFDVAETPRTIGRAKIPGMVTGAYDVFSPTPEANPAFLEYFYTGMDDRKAYSPLYSGMRNTISKVVFGGAAICLPPHPEQQAIADFLDFETGLIDKEIDLLTQKNELLSEQRKALIFEAVTGKIEITE